MIPGLKLTFGLPLGVGRKKFLSHGLGIRSKQVGGL
eukprot:CAMPEP_0172443490 /NCGR_PEP_ID=MMETSP1065-20121228/3748_1 /TAXON_ID=265537 /ORGANISM="Amphiprora paludosa, Strain CCMP125" /LENGTH=35 /DNA_ID= /DNA_START= /DNA_END= /DNA_ORIENTATION=